jgi:predicted TIM-barrel fold metal-dependent hydrolase
MENPINQTNNTYDHINVLRTVDMAQKENKLPFFNAHSHIFNFNHVNNHFLKGMIPWWVTVFLTLLFFGISYGLYSCIENIFLFDFWGLPNQYLFCVRLIISIIIGSSLVSMLLAPIYFILYISYFRPKLNLLLRLTYFKKIISVFRSIGHNWFPTLERYTNIILHSYDFEKNRVKSQEEIFNELQSYYPAKTKFVTLSMDLDYMVNCKKPEGKFFYDQLTGLEVLKHKSHELYPFIHTDPRRLADKKQDYISVVENHIKNGNFNGLKIYPANGYFPFDIRLKPIYDLALRYNIPIITHCSIGPVYYRGSLTTLENDGYYENGKFIHPFTGNELQGKNGKQFSPHFTHPLNYYCLMNQPDKLYKYWKKCERLPGMGVEKEYTQESLAEYRNLKICLGHFGGSGEWGKYLDDPWLPSDDESLKVDGNLLHLPNGKWVHTYAGADIKKLKTHSWHSIISDMICKKPENKTMMKNEILNEQTIDNYKDTYQFPYLYSDISYNLSNEEMYPLLKIRLESNKYLAEKILFGTDFFMVSTKATERRITMKVRSYIGEENFRKISGYNPPVFLASAITDINSIIK